MKGEEYAIPCAMGVGFKISIAFFDGTLEGIRLDGKPIFSVQHHPEASPGPQDSHYLFERFMDLIKEAA